MKEIDFLEVLNGPYTFKENKLYDTKENVFFTGKTVDKYNDGKVMCINPYKNGLLHGTKKSYNSNGKLEAEISIKENVREGFYKTYDEDGSLLIDAIFEKGYIKNIRFKGKEVNGFMQGENLIITNK